MSCVATCFSSYIWSKLFFGSGRKQNGIKDLSHSVPDFNHHLKNGVTEYKARLRGKINVRHKQGFVLLKCISNKKSRNIKGDPYILIQSIAGVESF